MSANNADWSYVDKLEKQLQAADALARLLRKYGSDHERLVPIGDALAAYEKVRALK